MVVLLPQSNFVNLSFNGNLVKMLNNDDHKLSNYHGNDSNGDIINCNDEYDYSNDDDESINDDAN